MSPVDVFQVKSERLFPNIKPEEQVVALSLLDATTVDFSASSVIWLCEKPDTHPDFDLSGHLRESLQLTLDAYPQWTGLLKGISTLNPDKLPRETAHFAPHARRYGRVYAHFGTSQDPGVEFVTARSTATLNTLCPAARVKNEPIYDRQKVSLANLVSSATITNAFRPNLPDESGQLQPLMAIQLTHLACGGFALAAKIGHPMSDIQSLVSFMKDWASVSRWILSGSSGPPPELKPNFDPSQLDKMASGDINAKAPDPAILDQITQLPLHRYDWWISTEECPWEVLVPDPYRNKPIQPIGKSMPWSEWDHESPVSHYVVHLTHEQVELIFEDATKSTSHPTDAVRISRHDAVLAHAWACIAHARNLQDDSDPVHCDLTFGSRGAFGLDSSFVGSPIMMVDIEMTGAGLCSPQIPEEQRRGAIAQKIRTTINQINRPVAMGAHLHSVAYETCPQRIWQAFVGGAIFCSTPIIRYVEPVMVDMDGIVVINDAPPPKGVNISDGQSWTVHGVDISMHLRAQDMERLIKDPLLLPRVK
ncbi:transferase family protein [Penicillium chermesinum]|nr:transferase family protein [Penicillium chermesinum]